MRGIIPNIHPGRAMRCRTNGKTAGDDSNSPCRIIRHLSRQRALVLSSLARHPRLYYPASAVEGFFPNADDI